jgi:hypothetical protein
VPVPPFATGNTPVTSDVRLAEVTRTLSVNLVAPSFFAID